MKWRSRLSGGLALAGWWGWTAWAGWQGWIGDPGGWIGACVSMIFCQWLSIFFALPGLLLQYLLPIKGLELDRGHYWLKVDPTPLHRRVCACCGKRPEPTIYEKGFRSTLDIAMADSAPHQCRDGVCCRKS